MGLQRDPVVIAVNANSPYQSLDELVAAANASQVPLNVAGDGPNSNNQLQLVVPEKLLGVDFNFIPFNGSAPSITALLGEQVDAAVPSASSATAFARRGDIRVLAVFSPDRYEYLPDAPTILEASGIAVPDIGAAVRGVAIPKGMAPGRTQVLEEAFANLVADEAFISYADQIQLPLYFMNAEKFRQYLAETDSLLDEYVGLLIDEPER